jgi:hypothetical protein
MCYSSLSLAEVNPRYPMRSDESAESAYKSLMCVQTDNSGTKGTFYSLGNTLTALYPDPSELFDTSTSAIDCQTSFNYDCYTERIPRHTSVDAYHSLDTIGVRTATDPSNPTDVSPVYNGYLPLPSANGAGSACEDTSLVLFGAQASNTCTRTVANAAELMSVCTTVFNHERYTTKLHVASKQSLKDKTTADSLTDYIAVTAVDASSATAAAPGATAWDGASCNNAVLGVSYSITYDENFFITAVVGYVTTGTITAGLATSESVPQTFSVAFTQTVPDATVDERSIDTNNLLPRLRSGNPGYIDGLPVLGGHKRTNIYPAVDIIDSWITGLPVMSSADGKCDTTAVSNVFATQAVTFGDDMATGCTVALTKAELTALCSPTATETWLQTTTAGSKIPKWLMSPVDATPTDSYVGIFGNADPYDVTQWLKVASLEIEEDPAYTASSGQCENFPTHAHYKFAYTNVGNTQNPQKKIIAARVEYSSQPMKFDDKLLGTSATNDFEFGVRVSWKYVQVDETIYSPPPPPIIFSVPYDVFYPFQIDSAAPSVNRGGLVGMLVGAAVVAACSVGLLL